MNCAYYLEQCSLHTCTVKLAGLRCVASSLGSLLVAGHEAALSEEMENFEQVSKYIAT